VLQPENNAPGGEQEVEMEEPAVEPQQNQQNDQQPPPPPNLVEVMTTQTQLMQQMAQANTQMMQAMQQIQGNQNQNRQGHREEDLQRKIERFIRLKAPTFDYSDEPLDAHDWLRTIETKLDLTDYTEEECVALAAHQLEGAAKAWWESYCDSHANPAQITWLEFCEAFKEYHIPE
jgi:DNA repair ATPase RecN